MSQNKVIVFDLDDTLVKEIDFLESAFEEIAFLLSPDEKEEVKAQMLAWYYKRENVFQLLSKAYAKELSFFKEIYSHHFPHFDASLSVRPFIKELKSRGYTLGIITDGISVTQRNKLKSLGIESIFDLIIISEEFGSEKPSLKNFEIFHQFDAEYYYYVADNPRKDFLAPNQLGWTTICVLDNGRNIHFQDFTLDAIYLPRFTVKALSEIVRYL